MSATFEFYKDESEEYRWRFIAANGNIMADSGEGYQNEADAREGARRFVELAPTAEIVDVTEEKEESDEGSESTENRE